MIRRILLASAGLTALAGTAFAADLPPPPPPPPPPPLWTGFYIGVNAGYEWAASHDNSILTAPLFTDGLGVVPQLAALGNASLPLNTNGFIGGGQIGYNYQFGSSWLAGIEADIDGIAGANRSQTFGLTQTVVGVPVTSDLYAQESLRYLGTVRGRIGFLATPTFLIYGSGGLAYGGVSATATVFQSGTNGFVGFGGGRISNAQVGWTAGGGVEWMFLPNWSAKVEYLYYDLGTVTSTFPLNAVTPVPPAVGVYAASQNKFRVNGNVIRAGLNYHFNWGAPAPVVAKY